MRKLNCALFLMLLGTAIAPARADGDVWHLLIEPTFMHYEAAWPIQGSRRAVFVPARFVDGEILPLQRSEVRERGVSREEILATAIPAASAVLATLKPRYVRDDNKVIQYAVLESDSPLTASAVLAPEFSGMFKETLGPDVVIAIPNRFQILVFPKMFFQTRNVSDLIFRAYYATAYPVTREIFVLQKGKLIAIGRSR